LQAFPNFKHTAQAAIVAITRWRFAGTIGQAH
jgi:hypothetical protein